MATGAEVTPPAPPRVVTRSRPADPNVMVVEIDENGEGSALWGDDFKRMGAFACSPSARCVAEEAHTVGITRLSITGAEPGSKVTVTVTRK